MKTRSLIAYVCAACLLLAAGAVAVAEDQERPHEGKIIALDQSAKSMTVQGEKDDQWTLYWNESTQLDQDLTVQELKAGDEISFDFTEKDGKKWLTELRLTERAEKDD